MKARTGRDELDLPARVRVGEIVQRDRPYVSFPPRTSARAVLADLAESAEWQDVFPVIDAEGKLLGVIASSVLRTLSSDPILLDIALAVDPKSAAVVVSTEEDAHDALERLLKHGVRELVVVDAAGRIVGLLDEAEIQGVYYEATREARLARTG